MVAVKLPEKDSLLLEWLENFVTVATANATDLGLSTGQITTITAYVNSFETNYEASQLAKVEAKSKVAAKNSSRNASRDLVNSFAVMISKNPNVSDSLKVSLGMTVVPDTSSPLVQPTELVVTPTPTGVNQLAWARGMNSKSASFVISAKIGAATEWSIIGYSSALKFDHEGQVPGQQVVYQVAAQRGSATGPVSLPATAYPVAEPEAVFLQAAA